MRFIRRVRSLFARPLSLAAILTMVGLGMILFLILIVRLAASWHTAPITMKDMVGTYTLDYKSDYGYLGKETLILKEDGTYIQIYAPAKGPTVRNNGKWDLHYLSNGVQMFSLYDAIAPMDVWGKPNKAPFPRNGGITTTPMRFMGKIQISGDPNFDLWYHKVK